MTTAAARSSRSLRLLIVGGVLALLVGLALIPEVQHFLVRGFQAMTSRDPQVTRAFVDDLGWAGPLALLVAYVVQAVILFLPSVAITAVTVRAYGPVEGFLLVYAGTLLGAAAGYGLGRALGDTLVRALAGERARTAAHEFTEKHGVQGVVLVRLMPALPGEAVSLVAGATRMGFRPFMLATAAGVLPVTLLVVWLSESIERLIWGGLIMSLVVAAVTLTRFLLQRR